MASGLEIAISPESLPASKPLTKEPEDSGYEIEIDTFSSPEPIASFSRRRLGTRHEGLWRHTKFDFFDWLIANNEILKRK